jgi:hypothetical protein
LIARKTAERSRDVFETCFFRACSPLEGALLSPIKESAGKALSQRNVLSFQAREGGA